MVVENRDLSGLWTDLVVFLHEQSHAYEVNITPDTAIEDDLGVTGEDGEELIVAYSKRYQVDITGFLFNKYFFPEPFVNTMPDHVALLTAAHLLKGITAGRLDEAVINS
ncbi:DUF1493 family protein [Chitinophaga arvensicola]|uniref:DUF1493 family protein n=1 Tax=Chitinophaga arvensicola TaxID=29529 RepID=A0A1I0RQ06_9BACT|nr:DUF1493 family protein [Chitinophaga arvensicola]SEW43394.1 Protein of unknown function [Chitinophaga arvensicola]